MKMSKKTPAQREALKAEQEAARRLMHHINDTTPGGMPESISAYRGVVTVVAKVWVLLIILLVAATVGFQVSKATSTQPEAEATQTKTLEIPL